jgi:hypothetical protein
MFKDREVNSVPLHRWYNHNSGDHFYTTDANGELAPQGGYLVSLRGNYWLSASCCSPQECTPISVVRLWLAP